MYNFSGDNRAFDTSNNIDAHKYLMIKHKIMIGLIKKTYNKKTKYSFNWPS